MKTTTKVILGVAAAAIAVGVVTFLNRIQVSQMGMVSEVERAQRPVQVQVLKSTTLTETIEHTGVLEANQDVVLTAEVAGKIRKVFKDLGDPCKQGEPLFLLDGSSYRIAWLQASAALKQAQTVLDQAEREHQRTQTLHQQSVATDYDLERTEAALMSAQATVEQAKAAVSMTQRNLSETAVRCPFDGALAQRLVDVGQVVGPQTPLGRVVDSSQLKLTVTVAAAQLARLEVGQKVKLADSSLPSLRYEGVVARLGVAADLVTRTFPVEVLVPGGDDGPRPGQVVRAAIEVAVYANVVAVPEAAVARDGQQAVVFLAVDGKAKKVDVATGAQIDGRVILERGVSAGDSVIVVGHDGLQTGDAVSAFGEDVTAAPGSGGAPEPADVPAPTAAATANP